MIRIDASIRNPFKHKPFKNIWTRAWKVSKNKTLEVQIYRYGYNLAELTVDTYWQGEDHAGPRFDLGIFGWYFTVNLHDNRHWDFVKGCWSNTTED